ncbi:MAG: dynamin family protein [Candidatus Cloacimonetes bacterium]|nr:dynamin family protein [Candidatus Cloacimonadota bacterium]
MTLNHLQKMSHELGQLFPQNEEKELYYVWQLTDDRLLNPSAYVTLAGETSGGKSTLINSIFKQQLLPVSAKPTTGTVVHINCVKSIQHQYVSLFKNNEFKQLSRTEFAEYSKNPPDNLLRLYTEVKPHQSSFIGLNLFDTPGINSLYEQHEEVLKQFIPNSDVVIYVVLYRVGFNTSDKDLVEFIRDSFIDDKDIPVLLIVNRCPDNVSVKDKRIKEIISHAEDTLLRPVELFMVNSLNPEEKHQHFPECSLVWDRVLELINTPERSDAVVDKLKNLLKDVCRQLKLFYDTRILATELTKEEISVLENEITEIEKKRDKSYQIIDKYMSQLEKNIPKDIEQGIKQIKKKIESEIYDTNKWTAAEECTVFIGSHLIPFELRQMIQGIQDYTVNMFNQMDDELSEMADLTIKSFNNRVNTVNNPDFANLIQNIATRLSVNIGKNLLKGMAIAKGGVGGTAAGTANLVKMMVSRTGKLFNKTFSRSVYKVIGKTFTKRMMQRLNIVFHIAVEAVSYLYSSSTWQPKLIKSIDSSLDKWADETIIDFKNKTISEYTTANKELVKGIYEEEFIAEINKSIKDIQNKIDQEEIEVTKGKIKQLKAIFDKLEEN